jgi:hypothetical protein
MATVYFGPFKAVKYVGKKTKPFSTSLARPKPTLRRGDIVILEKRAAFNLVKKGFEEFEYVESIEFVKADRETAKTLNAMSLEIETLKAALERSEAERTELVAQLEREKADLSEQVAELQAKLDAYETAEPLPENPDDPDNDGEKTDPEADAKPAGDATEEEDA